jgi:hypothetical protein|tara:strand:+ start:235 stop:789 length:555 start_codon:yes stop_codon:yes gene_type:complete
MKKAISIIVIVLIVLGTDAWLTLNLRAKQKYDKMRNELSQLSYSAVTMDADTTSLLTEVREKWRRSHSQMDGPHSDALKTLELDPSVSSLAHVFTYRLPRYSLLSIEKNKKSATMALVQGLLMPVAIDESIHVSANGHLALIQIHPNCVLVFADENSGLREEMYVQGNIEQSSAGDFLKAALGE